MNQKIKKVGIGIIGAGLMGREIAAALGRWPALIDHPVKPELKAVCDINPIALEWFKSIETVKDLYLDYQEMLNNPEIDVIYVAVRHDLHEKIYCDIINSGKSLLAEKPFGIDRSAADNILLACKNNPESFVRCSSEMPFFPGAQIVINYIKSGALGQIISAKNSFLHASDLDPEKPLNWKRQNKFCGDAGVLNDLGLHAWHIPLRLNWVPTKTMGFLNNIITNRKTPSGEMGICDTWDNAVSHSWINQEDTNSSFVLTTETKRIAPGEKNTWEIEVHGLNGSIKFSTKNPKKVEVFETISIPGHGSEQSWQQIDAGSQSVWPTVTGPNFESGFSDSILQMWAVYLAEMIGELGTKFACVTPEEAAYTHKIYDAVISSHENSAFQEIA